MLQLHIMHYLQEEELDEEEQSSHVRADICVKKEFVVDESDNVATEQEHSLTELVSSDVTTLIKDEYIIPDLISDVNNVIKEETIEEPVQEHSEHKVFFMKHV